MKKWEEEKRRCSYYGMHIMVIVVRLLLLLKNRTIKYHYFCRSTRHISTYSLTEKLLIGRYICRVKILVPPCVYAYG